MAIIPLNSWKTYIIVLSNQLTVDMRNVNVLCLVIMYYTKIYTYVINIISLRNLRSRTVQLPLQHVKLNISVYYVIYDNLPLANAAQIKISPCLNGTRYVARSDVKISAVDRPE